MILKGISVNQNPPTKDYLWITPKGNTRFWDQSTWRLIGGNGGGGGADIPTIEAAGKYLVTTGTEGNYSMAWSDIDLSSYINGTSGYAAVFNGNNSIISAIGNNSKIRIGDGIIEWDSTNNGFKIYNATSTQETPTTAGIYADWVSALGANSSGGGGGGDINWANLTTWDEDQSHIININYLPISLNNGVITIGDNRITPLTSHQDISGKADKTITITGTNGLSGGGTLEQNRTIGIDSTYKSKIDNILSMFELDSNGDIKTKDKPNNGGHRGFYSESFISALGANSSGGGGGGGEINWADFWNELNGTYDPPHYSGNTIIDIDYIPNLSASKITSETFDAARIPTLSITDKTSGTLPVNRGGTGTTSLSGVLVGNGTNAITGRTIMNNTSVGALGWTSASGNGLYIPTLNTLAYWNGAYSGTTSNINYLGTIKQILTLYNESPTGSNYGSGLRFYNKDTTTGQQQDTSYIFAYNTHSSNNYGMNMVIQSAGNIFIGGGESPSSLYSTLTTSTNENLYCTADGTIYLESNADTIANRLGIAINTNGAIVPVKAEAANNNAQNIGASNNKWANVYAVNFSGDLSGNADTATKATQDGNGNTISTTYVKIMPYSSKSVLNYIKDQATVGQRTGVFLVNGSTYAGAPDTDATYHIMYDTNSSIGNGIALFAHKYGSSNDAYIGYTWRNANNEPTWTKILSASNYSSYALPRYNSNLTAGYIPKLSTTGQTDLANSIIFENSNGIGIGTTSPAYKLDVAGDIKSSTNIRSIGAGEHYIEAQDTTSSLRCLIDCTNSQQGLWTNGYWNGSSFVSSSLWMLYRTTDGHLILGTNTETNGNFWATGGVTALQTSSSDKRLKKEIKPFNAKQIVDKLSPVEFEWNKKANKYNSNLELNKKNYGLIAQDSDGIIDNLVFDLPDGKGYKGVRYEKLIPILLQAVKEQQKEIDELKQIIKNLKV